MSNPFNDLPRLTDVMSPAWVARLRTTVTLAVLVLLVYVAVRIGLDQVAEPFPQSEETPICQPTAVQDGDKVSSGDVTVSVLNAGGPDGLASRTMSDLRDRGFGGGQLANAPDDTPKVGKSQIWTNDGTTAAVKLVRSYLKGRVRVVDREGPAVGINVVVGNEFKGVKDGRAKVTVRDDETTCVPTAPLETPAPATS